MKRSCGSVIVDRWLVLRCGRRNRPIASGVGVTIGTVFVRIRFI